MSFGRAKIIKVFENIRVAGVTFNGRQKYLSKISETDPAELVREPENKYDSNAIKVIVRNFHMGYIPKQIARELKEYKNLSATIRWINRREEYYGMAIDIFRPL